MSAPTVLIAANPYEAEMVRRAVDEAGMRAALLEAEDPLDRYDRESPSAVVLALNLLTHDALALLDELRRRPGPRVPVLVIDDPDGALAKPLRARERGADHLLLRPVDPILLAAKIEALARGVDDELEITIEEELTAEDAGAVVIESAPLPARTEVIATPVRSAPSPSASLMRADDAVLDFARTIPELPAPAPTSRSRRRLEDALSAAEQRLFPGTPATGSTLPAGGALGDELDLDTLAADTLPGVELELTAELSFAPPKRVEPPLPALQPSGIAAEPPAPHPAEEGDLADVGLPQLLARLYRAGFTGRLTLRRGEGEKALFLDGGYPIFASSNLPHDQIYDLLWREGRITREQHGRAAAAAAAHAEALLILGLLRRDEIFAISRRHVEEVLYSCFAWERGSWSLSSQSAGADQRVRIELHPYALALEGIRRKYGLERLVELVGGAHTVIAPVAGIERMAALAGLTPAEEEAARRLGAAAQTIAELGSWGGLDDISAYALVHGLVAIGAAVRAQVAPSELPTVRPLPVDRERAAAKHAQILDGDYFAVLGVQRDATSYEIRRAWERVRDEFSPDNVGGDPSRELVEMLSEIKDVVDEAHRLLADAALREAYRARLPPTRDRDAAKRDQPSGA